MDDKHSEESVTNETTESAGNAPKNFAGAEAPTSTDTSAIEPETTTLAFIVADVDAGARLDAFLAARIEGISRTRLKHVIEDGDVLVGARTAKASYKLRAGDSIELDTPATPACDFTPEDIPLDIVYEDDALIVLNKPAGLVVHPAAGAPSGTLANALAFRLRNAECGLPIEESLYLPNSAFRVPQSIRPGIVHRLDRDTSGLMVVAKTGAAHEHLADQFRAREVFKSYVALVHGRVREESGRIEEPIARDPRQRTRMAVVRGGRPALSLYRVRHRYERFTLLDVQIKTGRTHQIRVHLAWLKHPVVGDKVYHGGRDTTVADVRVRAAINRMGRQFLHAAQLGFRHPLTGESLRFDAPLPAELSRLLEALELTA
ncbi:MAG: RluA family pseudouridine synthase [Pyrinomonadaceae bacterium]